MQFQSRNRGSIPLPVSKCIALGYGVMAVTQDFGSWSPGSSPGSPTVKIIAKYLQFEC